MGSSVEQSKANIVHIVQLPVQGFLSSTGFESSFLPYPRVMCPHITEEGLRLKGLTKEQIKLIEDSYGPLKDVGSESSKNRKQVQSISIDPDGMYLDTTKVEDLLVLGIMYNAGLLRPNNTVSDPLFSPTAPFIVDDQFQQAKEAFEKLKAKNEIKYSILELYKTEERTIEVAYKLFSEVRNVDNFQDAYKAIDDLLEGRIKIGNKKGVALHRMIQEVIDIPAEELSLYNLAVRCIKSKVFKKNSVTNIYNFKGNPMGKNMKTILEFLKDNPKILGTYKVPKAGTIRKALKDLRTN